MNNSGSLNEMDMSAPPSIPVGPSPDKDTEKSNLISLQKVDEGSRPKIITPSDWGAPDLSQRTGPNHNLSQSRHSEFTNNNYEGGDKQVIESQEINRLNNEVRNLKEQLDRTCNERD